MENQAGYLWLRSRYQLATVQPSPVVSRIGPTRSIRVYDGVEHRVYPENLRPDATLAAHLTFALKHEGVDLEFLARLFAAVRREEMESWIRSEPSGQYARRAGFFYEWLTGTELRVPNTVVGNYQDALDPELEVTNEAPINVTRWRIRDNLLGGPRFCPQVRLTDGVKQARRYDVGSKVRELESSFGSDLLTRSAMWLSLKESRASFTIENEGDKEDRIRRFARVIGDRTGVGENPLQEPELLDLQREILGPNATHYGLRQSPIYIGERERDYERVHYIAPHWDDYPAMVEGLRYLEQKTARVASVIRAALVSFGFVYIHPLVDGNGRVSRFLINDLLRRDGALPAPYILPVSAAMQDKGFRPRNYDHTLELFSRKLLANYTDAWRFGQSHVGADGVEYNIEFDAYANALPAWRYPDYTGHVEFMGSVLSHTIEREMRVEAEFLQQLFRARDAVKDVMDGPNEVIDRVIRSIRDNQGEVSGKLRREIPQLEDAVFAERVVNAIRESFPWQVPVAKTLE